MPLKKATLKSLPHNHRPIVLFTLLILLQLAAPLLASKANYITEIQPILQKRCYACHGPEKQKGKLRLDTISTDLINDRKAARHWQDVRSAINLGEMPPEEEPTLSADERRTVLSWLNSEIKSAADSRKSKGGRVVVRRLNRAEYQNTMRDLLGLDISFVSDLPPDGVSVDGMLNNGSALQMTGIQFEYYLKAARVALDHVITTTPAPKVFEYTFKKSTENKWHRKTKPSNRLGKDQEFIARIKNDYPETGEFRIRIRAKGEFNEDTPGPLPRMRVMVGYRPDTEVYRKTLAEIDITKKGWHDYEFSGRMENFPLPVKGQGKYPGLVISVTNPYGGHPVIESLEFKGPIFESWPPAHHRQILHDSVSRSESFEPDYVREVIERFLPRAWRRPVTNDEVIRFTEFFKVVRKEMPTFEEAMKETLAMALVSPHFLYILEPFSAEQRPLTQHELAARLSYFLWSTMPDQKLLSSADSGELSKPDVLTHQVDRMLKHPRSQQFVENFVSQWLDIDALDRVVIDQKIHPGFKPELKGDMRRETFAFFSEVLHRNLSAENFIDSDFVTVNSRMARHYGIDGVMAGEFQRIKLTAKNASHRGGLLGQSSILTANSTGRDSNLIKRAVFLRKRLLNDPPAPPPPNVPELETADPDFAQLPIRKQLEIHLHDPACADCHRNLDPWGQALEQFNAIGLWREKIIRPIHGKKTIELEVDANAKLPDGHKIQGISGLKNYLKEHRRKQFARAFVSKILTYALGRSLELSDETLISDLTNQFLKNNLRVRDLLVAVVQRPDFQTK